MFTFGNFLYAGRTGMFGALDNHGSASGGKFVLLLQPDLWVEGTWAHLIHMTPFSTPLGGCLFAFFHLSL